MQAPVVDTSNVQNQLYQRSLARLQAGVQGQQITDPNNLLSDTQYQFGSQVAPTKEFNPQEAQQMLQQQYEGFNKQYQAAQEQYQARQSQLHQAHMAHMQLLQSRQQQQAQQQAPGLQSLDQYANFTPTPGNTVGNIIKNGNYLGISPFGNMRIPITQGDTPEHSKGAGANAWDYGAPVGTPARSVVAGRVIRVQDLGNKSYGKNIWIQGSDGRIYIYGHLSTFNVKQGMTVQPGQVIALTGATGHATGPHLHFEIRG